MQHVASFKAQLDLVQDAVKKMRSAQQPTDTSSAQRPADATAQAAAEEECFRAVVDLREAAQKLDKHQFQDKAKLLENVDKAMFVTPRQQCRDMQGDSAEQPVTSLGTAEQPLSSSAPHWDVDVFCSIEHLDAGGNGNLESAISNLKSQI